MLPGFCERAVTRIVPVDVFTCRSTASSRALCGKGSVREDHLNLFRALLERFAERLLAHWSFAVR